MPLQRTAYYRSAFTVPVGAVDQAVDVLAGIAPALGFTPAPTDLAIETDVDVAVKINSASAAPIPVTAAAGLTIPAEARLEIHQLYFSHTGPSIVFGNATVTVLAT